jgi:YHS domain-containing protein
MKKFATFLAMSLIAAGVASAAPANTVCPVSGKDADASITSKHKGQDVAFCCNKCKGKFDADPSKFEGKIKK